VHKNLRAAGSAITLVMSCVLGVVLAPSSAHAVAPASAAPAEAALAKMAPGVTAMPARTLDGRKVDGAAAAQAAASYWTPERMRSATAAALPRVTGPRRAEPQARPKSTPMVLDKQGARPLAEVTREAAGQIHATTVLSAIGKVFFVDPTKGNTTHYCSGSLLLSIKAKLLLTAGHCVLHDGVQMLQVAFAPDYPGNQTRYGVVGTVMPTRWANEGVSGYDYSIAVLGSPIGNLYGGNPLVYDAPASGILIDAFGFPGAEEGILRVCTGFTGGQALQQVGLPGCTRNDMGEGASGGPWIMAGDGFPGYVNGVNANFYPFDNFTTLYSPYFDDLTANIWFYAEYVS
jgi:hypothetical protein